MEASTIADAATADVIVRVGWYAAVSVASGVLAVLGTLLFGRGYKRRIAALEDQTSQPTLVIHDGGTYNRVEGGQHIHYHISGPAEVIQPKPTVGRATPLRVVVGLGEVEGQPIQGAEIERKKADDG